MAFLMNIDTKTVKVHCLSRYSTPPSSCVDGYGRSCLVLALLAMMLDEDLPAASAIEHVRQSRGPAAIQTIKVHVQCSRSKTFTDCQQFMTQTGCMNANQ